MPVCLQLSIICPREIINKRGEHQTSNERSKLSRGRVLTEKRSWEMGHGEGREAPRGNEHWGLLSQGPQRSHTWWKRLFLTMSSTTCR